MKTLKRIQSMLLAFCLVLSGCLLTPDYGVVKAEAAEVDAWDSENKTWIDDGDNIWNVEIDTAEKLVAFSALVIKNATAVECNATLTSDIDMSGVTDWMPIGGITSATSYWGTFDGQHYRIKNLHIDSSNSYQGLFGYVGFGTEKTTQTNIKNVILDESCSITSAGSSVGLVAFLYRGYIYISACGNEADITGTNRAGGIVGQSSKDIKTLQITNCYNTGKITGTKGSATLGVAGIVGLGLGTRKITINNSYNLGEISPGELASGTPLSGSVYAMGASTEIQMVQNCYGINPTEAETSTNVNEASDVYAVNAITEGMEKDAGETGLLNALQAYEERAYADVWAQRFEGKYIDAHPIFAGSIKTVYVATTADGAKHEMLADALVAAAEATDKTVTMLVDTSTDETLVLIDGVTLDLAGKTLDMGTTGYLVAFDDSKIVDSTSSGLLKVADTKCILPKDHELMPVWNGTGYKFAVVGMEQAVDVVDSNNISFMIRPSFEGVEESLIAGGQAGAKVRAGVRLTWTTGSEAEGTLANHVQDCYYSDAFHNMVYNAESKTGFSFAVSGLTGFDNITATPMVVSDLGVLFTTALATE